MKNRISFIALLLALSIFVLGCGLSTKEKSSLRCINRYMEAYEIFDYIEMYQCYPPYTQDKGESITDTFGEMVGIANGFDIGMNLPSNFAAAVMNDSDIEVKYKYKEILESEFDGSVGYLEVIYRLIIKCDGKKEKLDIVAPFYMVKDKNKWYIAQPLEIYEYKEDDFKKSAKKDKYDFSDHSAAYEIEDNLYDFYSIVSDSLGESDKAIKLDSRNKNESGIKGNASDKIHSMVDSFFITINSMTTLKDSEASEKVINIQDDVIEHFEPVADTPTVSLESETEEVSNEKVNEAINDEKESEILIDTDDLTGNTQTVNKVNLVDIKASSSLDGFGVENLTDGDIK